MSTSTSKQEVKVYKANMFGYASGNYQRDLKKHVKQGWKLVSCTETGRDWVGRVVLTAIYEK